GPAADALADVSAEALTAEDIIGALNDELDDGIEAFRDYFGAAASDEETMIKFRDNLRDIADLQKDVNDGTLKGQERIDEFAKRIIDGTQPMLDMGESLARQGVPIEEIADRMNDLTDELFDTADEAGLTKREVGKLRDELGLMPEDIQIAIETNLAQITEQQK